MTRFAAAFAALLVLAMVFLAGWRVGLEQSRAHYAAAYERDHSPIVVPVNQPAPVFH